MSTTTSTTLATQTAGIDKATDQLADKAAKARRAFLTHLLDNCQSISAQLAPTGPSAKKGRKTAALTAAWAEWKDAYAHHARPAERVRDISVACWAVASKPPTATDEDGRIDYMSRVLCWAQATTAEAIVAAVTAPKVTDPTKAPKATPSATKGKGRGAARVPSKPAKSETPAKPETPATPGDRYMALHNGLATALGHYLDGVEALAKEGFAPTKANRTALEGRMRTLAAFLAA